MSVLKSVMDKYPELITHDLSSWLACHSLGRNYNYYRPTLEGGRGEPFQYSTSFARESVLVKALCKSWT